MFVFFFFFFFIFFFFLLFSFYVFFFFFFFYFFFFFFLFFCSLSLSTEIVMPQGHAAEAAKPWGRLLHIILGQRHCGGVGAQRIEISGAW